MKITSIDEYIEQFPEDVREYLNNIRALGRELVPEAEEKLTYGVPSFVLNGILFNYAAFKKHVGFYPTPTAIEAFADKLTDYETAKGTIKFPFSKPMPYDLIKEIIIFRKEENLNTKKRK
jgi:uncharacterized protein YdhG (YjbR/CyaY superfamily)